MNTFQAIILGIIQGLTEFLPISSSGHLVLFQNLFGLKEPNLFFDISVHMGTLIAVIIFFRKEISSIIVSLFQFSNRFLKKEVGLAVVNETPDVRLAFMIIIGSVPTAIIGLLFHKIAEQLFSSVLLVGCALIVTGLVLWLTRRVRKNDRDIPAFAVKDALIIGVVQGLAIIPGISRSGSTIAAGLFLNLNKEISARYSFLLSIPAIIGAEILSLTDVSAHDLNLNALAGTLAAGIVGYGALKLLVYMVSKGKLHVFAPYCWIVGVIALILGK